MNESRESTAGTAPLYNPYSGLYTGVELGRVRKYLREELQRSMKALRRAGRPSVYYLSYLYRNERTEKIWGRLGAINRHDVQASNTVYCDLRVGSHRYDNLTAGGLADNSDRDESVDYINMPAEVKEDAFKYGLWKLTDARYREAAEQYYEKKSRELHFVDPYRNLPSRQRHTPARAVKHRAFPSVDIDYWKYLVRKAGTLVRRFPRIKNSWIEFITRQNQHVFVNSERSEILRQSSIYELRAHLWMLSRKGEAVSQEVNIVEGDLESLPDEKTFLRKIRERIELVLALEKAPALNSYSGPVLLSPQACGVFFHEVIGHRLEGSRLLSPEEGATFRDLRGKKIAPDFIDIVDDPLLSTYGDRRMIGHFRYDDEGYKAGRAPLVEQGVLKNFLTTSAPIPGQHELNGHARAQSYERPISRMGNLFVLNRKPVSQPDMKRMFLEEIRRQKKPYGIHVLDVLGGETDTSSYDFQAFKGEIMYATRVYPDGREEPVRGVDFVGTPLSALDAVACLGDDPALDNSYCGAESGIVPVSTIAPSMLMRNLELQARNRERLTQYILPMPFEAREKKRASRRSRAARRRSR